MRLDDIQGRQGHRNTYDYGMSPDGRSALALGLVALLVGFASLAGGAYIGLTSGMAAIALPGGLAPAEPGTVALVVSALGTVTTLLGGISIYKAQEM